MFFSLLTRLRFTVFLWAVLGTAALLAMLVYGFTWSLLTLAALLYVKVILFSWVSLCREKSEAEQSVLGRRWLSVIGVGYCVVALLMCTSAATEPESRWMFVVAPWTAMGGVACLVGAHRATPPTAGSPNKPLQGDRVGST
jgi:hypothetical protein